MPKWTPATKWRKITEAEVKEMKAKPETREFWLREFCHCCKEWFVRYCVREPETEVWYKELN